MMLLGNETINHLAFYMKKTIKALKLSVLTKRLTLDDESVLYIDGMDCCFDLLLSSANPVIRVKYKDKVLFVKPFVKGTGKSKIEYVARQFIEIVKRIDKYSNEEIDFLQDYVDSFLDSDDYSEYTLLNEKKDEATQYGHSQKEIVAQFHKYLKKTLESSKYAPLHNNNQFVLRRYSISKAVYELYKLLGYEELISKPVLVTIIFDNIEIVGSCTEEVIGLPATQRDIKLTPQLRRDLVCYDFIDYLCTYNDRWPHNLMIMSGRSGGGGITSFDNDGASLFMLAKFHGNYQGYTFSKIIDNNKLNRPCIDEKLYAKLMKLTFQDLKRELSRYLSFLQILALERRILYLRKYIKKAVKCKTMQINKSRDWCIEGLEDELKGEYGLTYVKMFYERS